MASSSFDVTQGLLSSASERETTTATDRPAKKLPVRKVPGGYGLPIIGPILDRIDFFYVKGRDDFFKSRIQKYGSTVFRVNMPPGPFISRDPRVIAIVDAAAFAALFDNSLVEKKDLFTGTYMPSTSLTGGYRVLSYVDVAEPKHAPLKNLLFFMLSSRRQSVIPEFKRAYGELFQSLELEVAKKGKADFGGGNEQAAFGFLARALLGKDPSETKLGSDGPKLVTKWLLFQLGPLLTLGQPKLLLLEELLLHTFPLPPVFVKRDYNRLADFFRGAGGPILDEAERLGISREEAVHNILFAICFNSFGGMKVHFPNIIKWVGLAGADLQRKLAAEIRASVGSNGGEVTMQAMEQMPLTKSVVYEALRIEPPVPSQYGRARKDFVLESHDAAFEIRAGEMLYGFQPLATKDPRVFDRAEEFVGDRFVGKEGEKLLKHVLWSNGPETDSPTTSNKQCAGKDFVVLVARMLVVEWFLRYDEFAVEVGTSPLGSSVKVTSLKKASP